MEVLIGLIFSLVLFLLSVLISEGPSRRWIRRFLAWLFRRDPAAAVEPDIALFEGRVEVLTDELLSHPADATRTRQFYEMERLDWDIIAADSDVKRDQQDYLIERARHPACSLRFICILGKSGSGKSTLAWRVAAELHTRHGALVIRVKDGENPEVWYRMTEFCHRVGRPLYVLVDDLFRNAEVRRALAELSPWLSLTVLATSQENDYSPGRLKGEITSVSLGPPSSAEKKRVLRCLGQDFDDLDSKRLVMLNAANEFLVLMVELTLGKGFQEVIQDSLDNLLRLHEPVYHAYEYICFSYSYGVAIPASLLDRLDADGRYYDLPGQDGARGFVSYDESNTQLVCPGHLRRAEMARRLFEKHRASATVLAELVKAVDVLKPLERRFIAHLLRSLACRRIEIVEEVLLGVGQKIAECLKQAGSASELTTWRALYLALDRPDEADRCVDAALAIEPVSSIDFGLMLWLYRERGRECDALPLLDRWIHTRPESSGGRPEHLGLVGRYGTPGQQEKALDETRAWLAKHADDNVVRPAYLGLARREGTPKHVMHALRDTSTWLAKHADDNVVRPAYLALARQRGAPREIERALQQTSTWLAKHADNVYVWAAYLGLAEQRGVPRETERVLQETTAWLAEHRDDSVVRAAYLGLVECLGTTKQTERALQETSAWLEEHPDDVAVRAAYSSLVQCLSRAEEIEDALQETIAWLRIHPSATDDWVQFTCHVCRLEKPDNARAFAEEAVAVHSANSSLAGHYLRLAGGRPDEATTGGLCHSTVTRFPHAPVIRNQWACWLHTNNCLGEAEEVFKTLVEEHPEYRHAYGRLLLDMEHYGESAEQFERVLASRHHHAMAHDGLAQAVRGLARGAEEAADDSEAARLVVMAEHELKRAIHWAGIVGDRQGIFFAHLGWFYIDRKRWGDALAAFDQAVSESPKYFANYWGQGCALAGLERWSDALSALRTALKKAPDDLEPPASDDIPQLLERCETEVAKEPERS